MKPNGFGYNLALCLILFVPWLILLGAVVVGVVKFLAWWKVAFIL